MYIYIYYMFKCAPAFFNSMCLVGPEIGTDAAAALQAHQCSGCSTLLYISSVCTCVRACVWCYATRYVCVMLLATDTAAALQAHHCSGSSMLLGMRLRTTR